MFIHVFISSVRVVDTSALTDVPSRWENMYETCSVQFTYKLCVCVCCEDHHRNLSCISRTLVELPRALWSAFVVSVLCFCRFATEFMESLSPERARHNRMITIEHTPPTPVTMGTHWIHTHFVGFINYRQTFFNRKHNRHMPVTVIAVVAVCIKHVLWLGMFSHSNITYMDQFHSVICDACHCVVVVVR